MGKTFDKIKETSKNWLKKFGAILASIFSAVLVLFTFNRINEFIKQKDTKKKQDIKDNMSDVKETVEEIQEIQQEQQEIVQDVLDTIETKQTESEADKADYVESQQQKAESVGFVKKNK